MTSGTFQLRFKNVLTAAIAFNATAAEVQAIFEAHPAIGAGNVTCTQATGTNMADGNVQCDFTVGDLRWEYWEGSTGPRVGGQMAIVNSTLTGGTVSISILRIGEGRCVSFKTGQGVLFTGIETSQAAPISGWGPPFIQVEGSAIGAAGFNHGFTIYLPVRRE